jgi:hypothetical protein
MPALQDSLPFLRYIYSAVLVVVVLLALAAETRIPRREAEPALIVYILYALAAGDTLIALIYRRRFSGPAAETLRANPEDAQAQTDWMKGQMVPLPMALGVGLMGFAARVLGVPTLHAAPLFVAAVVLLLVLRPSESSV